MTFTTQLSVASSSASDIASSMKVRGVMRMQECNPEGRGTIRLATTRPDQISDQHLSRFFFARPPHSRPTSSRYDHAGGVDSGRADLCGRTDRRWHPSLLPNTVPRLSKLPHKCLCTHARGACELPVVKGAGQPYGCGGIHRGMQHRESLRPAGAKGGSRDGPLRFVGGRDSVRDHIAGGCCMSPRHNRATYHIQPSLTPSWWSVKPTQ